MREEEQIMLHEYSQAIYNGRPGACYEGQMCRGKGCEKDEGVFSTAGDTEKAFNSPVTYL